MELKAAVQELLTTKVNISDFEDTMKRIEKPLKSPRKTGMSFQDGDLEIIKKELMLKANVKDVVTLLDTKASILFTKCIPKKSITSPQTLKMST